MEKEFIFKVITLTYNGHPGVNGIGATWFVFTMVWLYFLSPFVAKLVGKIQKIEIYLFALIIIIISGFILRLRLLACGFDWYTYIYTPFYANLDLYFSGFLLSYALKAVKKQIWDKKEIFIAKLLSIFLLVGTIIVNIYISMHNQYIYQCYFPTIYIIIVLIYITVFYKDNQLISVKPLKSEVRKYPLKLIDVFANYSFEFYLFHSIILDRLNIMIKYDRIFRRFLILLVAAFILSEVCAVIFNKIFDRRKEKIIE